MTDQLPTLPSPSIIPEVTPFDMSNFVANDNVLYCKTLKQEVGYVGKRQAHWLEFGLSFKQLTHALQNHFERPFFDRGVWFYKIERRDMVCPSLIIYRMAEDAHTLAKTGDANVLALIDTGWTGAQITCFGQAAVHLATTVNCTSATLKGFAHA